MYLFRCSMVVPFVTKVELLKRRPDCLLEQNAGALLSNSRMPLQDHSRLCILRSVLLLLFFNFILINLFFLSLFILRESVYAGEGQRERGRESKFPSRLLTVSMEPNVGLKLTSHKS